MNSTKLNVYDFYLLMIESFIAFVYVNIKL